MAPIGSTFDPANLKKGTQSPSTQRRLLKRSRLAVEVVATRPDKATKQVLRSLVQGTSLSRLQLPIPSSQKMPSLACHKEDFAGPAFGQMFISFKTTEHLRKSWKCIQVT